MKNFALYGVIVALFAAVAAAAIAFGLMQEPSTRPKQPIEYPHHTHVQDVGMQCLDCHRYAEKSIYATLPGTDICMGCHESIATDKPDIMKLAEAYRSGKPVGWVRVYQVKPHVYFSHKRHVLSGMKCQECHGPVEQMTTVQRVTDLGMGWCVKCHRTRGAPRECDTCHK
jgi:predicted CXXCH cytochrome family protein